MPTTNRKIRGEIVNHDSPNWAPLQNLVGLELTGLFMWMFEVELRNRTRLHAYKHRFTRGYLHIARDGRCFMFLDDDSYRQITQHAALLGVFDYWRDDRPGMQNLTRRERAALDFTMENASFALLEPGELSPLDPKFVPVEDDLDPDESVDEVAPSALSDSFGVAFPDSSIPF